MAVAISLTSSGYIVFAILCVRHSAARTQTQLPESVQHMAITVMKPLCGLDHDLLENLRSFCRQRYTEFQIIFGVMDRDDPAVNVVEQLIGEFPQLDLKLVIDDRIHGSNLKVSNLVNMYASAKHDLIVIADSDMRVTEDYLARLNQSLQDDATGMVTCLYLGAPLDTLPSRLGAMFINEWFIPSVLVATRYKQNSYSFGATMAMSRQVLEETGGFASLADYLADDFMLGKAVVDSGRRVAIAPVFVENILLEPSFMHLFQHELRWARTVRTVQPVGYACSFLTDALPISMLAALIIWSSNGFVIPGLGLVGFALLLRGLLHLVVSKAYDRQQAFWLCPVRDILTFLIRIASFMGGNVEWREQSLYVHNGSHVSAKR